MIARILIAGLLRADHGMSADKLRGESQSVHRLLNRCFDTANIGNQTLRSHNILEFSEVSDIDGDRRAQKKNIAGGKTGIHCVKELVEHAFLTGKLACFTVCIESVNDGVRVHPADCLCDGASDESEPDETDGKMFCVHYDKPPNVCRFAIMPYI